MFSVNKIFHTIVSKNSKAIEILVTSILNLENNNKT
jgi:hypothetical protein